MNACRIVRLPIGLISIGVAIVIVSVVVVPAAADISYGGYTFNDNAFADRVEDNDGGTYSFNNATTLDEALLGFTPLSGLYNMDRGGNSNDFTLYFDDLAAVDNAGADIVLFDVRYSRDTYEIAVITGGIESAFMVFDFDSQVNTGESYDAGAAVVWAIEIDLASYGVASAEAIRFRGGPSDTSSGNPQADPTMAGVLGVPAPGSLVLVGVGIFAGLRRRSN
jgi:hypothetical protein